MATENARLSSLKPQLNQQPVLYIVALMTSPQLKDVQIRVSRDVNSAQAFAMIYNGFQYQFNYTVVPIKGVLRPPIPTNVYILISQRSAQDFRNIGIGAFQTLEEAQAELDNLRQNTEEMHKLMMAEANANEENTEKAANAELEQMQKNKRYGHTIFTIKQCTVCFGLSEEEDVFIQEELDRLLKSCETTENTESEKSVD